jgi:hypothetical protein
VDVQYKELSFLVTMKAESSYNPMEMKIIPRQKNPIILTKTKKIQGDICRHRVNAEFGSLTALQDTNRPRLIVRN